MRFAELAVGQFFRIEIGGAVAVAEKTAPTEMRIKKLNSPGFITRSVDPELNEDDVRPCAPPAWAGG
jgi:hypothetical protein